MDPMFEAESAVEESASWRGARERGTRVSFLARSHAGYKHSRYDSYRLKIDSLWDISLSTIRNNWLVYLYSVYTIDCSWPRPLYFPRLLWPRAPELELSSRFALAFSVEKIGRTYFSMYG